MDACERLSGSRQDRSSRRNEQIKLTATWLNSIAAAAVAVGGISPTIAAASGVISFGLAAPDAAWILVGLGLHLFARASLGRMRDAP